MPNEHQRVTAFLRHCLRYSDCAEHQTLDNRITRIQRDERSLKRTMWLLAALTFFALAVLGFGALFLDSFSPVAWQLLLKLVGALGLGSLGCLVVFAGLSVAYRKDLDRRREECRQLVMRLLEERLGKPVTRLAPGARDQRVGAADPAATNASATGIGSSARG